MRRAVLRRKAGAVHAENHRQILQRHIMHDAIVSALQERGVNGADGMETHRRHARGEQHRVFFRDADVVVTLGHGFFQSLQSGAAGHGGSDADDRVVLLAKLDHRLAEHVLLIRRRAGFGRQASRPVTGS